MASAIAELFFGSGPAPGVQRVAIYFYPTSEARGTNAAFVLTRLFGDAIKKLKTAGVSLDLASYRYISDKSCHILEGTATAQGRAFLGHEESAYLILNFANTMGKDGTESVYPLVNGESVHGCFRDVRIEILDKTVEDGLRAELAATKAELAATKAELAATKAELAATKAELAEARTIIAIMQAQLDKQQATLSEQDVRIAKLEKSAVLHVADDDEVLEAR